MNTPLVSVVVLSYNSRKNLHGLFTSLAQQTYSHIELIVVDNASSDDSVEYMESQAIMPITQLIKNTENMWYAKGCNLGLSQAAGEYVLFCNDDIVLDSQCIELLVEAAERTASGIVGGKLLKLMNGEKTHIIDATWLQKKRTGQVINVGEGESDTGQYDTEREVFGISGALLLISRECIAKLTELTGLFDETFIAYKEDVDLSWRAQRFGVPVLYTPKALAYHARTVDKQSLKNRMNRRKIIRVLSYRNHLKMLIKNLTLGNIIMQWPWLLSYEAAKFFYLLVLEPATLFQAFRKEISWK